MEKKREFSSEQMNWRKVLWTYIGQITIASRRKVENNGYNSESEHLSIFVDAQVSS